MKIHEYQAHEIFKQYAIPSAEAQLAYTPEQARQAAEVIGCPVVVKAQVLVGGRGKAGGVKVAGTVEEAYKHAGEILNLSIKSIPVEKVPNDATNILPSPSSIFFLYSSLNCLSVPPSI